MIKKVLITGGAGFIGVNAARYFLKEGWEVTLFDNFSRKGTDINVQKLEEEHASNIAVIKGDIQTDDEKLLSLVNEQDAVLHLAAQVAVTTSIKDPVDDFEKNVLGTFKVLEAIRNSDKQPPLIYSSTNKVYGALESCPVNEEEKRYTFQSDELNTHGVPESQSLDFHSPYGCSKGAADQYVIDYSRIYGLKTSVFRQSCIYGPHQFGVEDQGWVAWFSIAAMLGKPITIYGNGKQVRDLLYVDDLAELYAKGFENMEAINGQAYNIGGGPSNTLSLLELIEHLNEKYKRDITPSYSEIRSGDQPLFVADVRKIESVLGWKPSTDVETGVSQLQEWLQSNHDVLKKF